MRFIILILISLITFTLCGCVNRMMDQIEIWEDPPVPPAYPIDYRPPPKRNGTIYQAGFETEYFRDHVASRIGDIITVRLEEQTQGEKQAKSKADKKSSYETNLGGATDAKGNISPFILNSPIHSMIFDLGADFKFDGKGETNEFNKLHGTISVTVTHVLSNGNLIIRGESWITINQGREFIRLCGIIRSLDIEPGNTISSQRIANARITYTGGGLTGNAAKGGLITQLLYKYFPY